MSFSASGQSSEAFEAKALWPEHFAIELAGVVWVFAEVSILLLLIAAIRHVSGTPDRTFRLTRREKRQGVILLACLCVVSAMVLGRHGVIADPSAVETSLDGRTLIDPYAFSSIYTRAVEGHLIVWMIFASVWGFLEIAIGIRGVRLYRRLRVLLATDSR